MIVSAFHTRDDHWILPHKLRVLHGLCDEMLVICDRDPVAESIARQWPKVQVMKWTPTRQIADRDEHGSVTCEEGRMRQAAWDWCAKRWPDYILLGDTDEVFTPDIKPWLDAKPDPRVDVYYLDTVNLWQDVDHEIASGVYWRGHASANRKGVVCTWKQGRDYRYRDDIRHVRMEPSPLSEGRAVEDASHVRVTGPKLVHYKWANWPRWTGSPQSRAEKYRRYLDGIKTGLVSRRSLWLWDAEDLLKALPEPVALVGNGTVINRGGQIDACPTVIRFNNFATGSGRGERTDVWCTNCWDDVQMRPWTGAMFTPNSASHVKGRISRWLGCYPHMHIPMADWRSEAEADLGRRRPTTGMLALLRLLKLGKAVRLFGFDGTAANHPETHERELLDRLARNPLVVWNDDHDLSHPLPRPEPQRLPAGAL